MCELAFSTETSFTVKHDKLKTPVVFSSVKRLESGGYFLRLSKADSQIRRLLTAAVPIKPPGNNLCSTDIVEHIQRLRNAAVASLMKTESIDPEVEDLGIDDEHEQSPDAHARLPPTVEIQCPAFHDHGIAGVSFNVLSDMSSKVAWFEATSAAITYLMNVVALQLSNSECLLYKADHTHTRVKGATFVKQRNAYRIKLPGTPSPDKQQFKYINIKRIKTHDELKTRIEAAMSATDDTDDSDEPAADATGSHVEP